MYDELRIFFKTLAPLEEEAWADLEKIIAVKQVKRNEHFLKQDEVCKRLGFIVKGSMRMYYLVNGEEITKDFNFERSFCGSYASFSARLPSRFNSVAMEDTTLYTLDRDNLFGLFDKHACLQKLGRICIEQLFIAKEQREASFLLDPAPKRYENLVARHKGITQRVPLKHIASYLGIRPETLSRIRGNG